MACVSYLGAIYTRVNTGNLREPPTPTFLSRGLGWTCPKKAGLEGTSTDANTVDVSYFTGQEV